MSAPLASTSSTPLVAFAQDVDYSGTEGFKQFKVIYNQKNARCARNDPCSSYLMALEVYTTAKSSGMSQCEMGSLTFQDFVTLGSIAAHRCLKHISLTPYYTAQMKRCTQKWDTLGVRGPGNQ